DKELDIDEGMKYISNAINLSLNTELYLLYLCYFIRGLFYEIKKLYTDAINDFLRSGELLDVMIFPSQREISFCMVELGNYDKATEYYVSIIEKDKKDYYFSSLYYLSQIKYKFGKIDESLNDITLL